LEKATSQLEPVVEMEPTGDGNPDLGTHAGNAAQLRMWLKFFKISPASDIKCVAYMALKREARKDGGKPDTWHGVAAFLRGDHQVNETKLLGAVGAAELRTMQAEELTQYFNGPAGYLGPVGLKPDDKPLGDGLTVLWTSRSKGEGTLSRAPTSWTITCAM
jgi:prolyl-tRNA synthetase